LALPETPLGPAVLLLQCQVAPLCHAEVIIIGYLTFLAALLLPTAGAAIAGLRITVMALRLAASVLGITTVAGTTPTCRLSVAVQARGYALPSFWNQAGKSLRI
jgi:hypothetical protein